MTDWLTEAHTEVAALEAARRESTKAFSHKGGVPKAGKPDGDGVHRAEELAADLEALSRRLRNLVSA